MARAVVHVRIKSNIVTELSDSNHDKNINIFDWLNKAQFNPIKITLKDENITDATDDSTLTVEKSQAIDIIKDLPLKDHERQNATHYAYCTVNVWDDKAGLRVWGLVCVQPNEMIIRWRNVNQRSLENACNITVEKLWHEMGQETSKFEKFVEGQQIPIRETGEAERVIYHGEILPPGIGLEELAKKIRAQS